MKFENTEVWGFEHALRGMRNPKNSWDKSDSEWKCRCLSFEDEEKWCDNKCTYDQCMRGESEFCIGKNDMKLAQSLIRGGSEHRKFLRQIFVSVDITAPLYWWKEFDTYKIGTVANSTSTMHKIASQPITLECFEIDDYNPNLGMIDPAYLNVRIASFIEDLEQLRQLHLINLEKSMAEKLSQEERDKYCIEAKRYWKELIRWLPESWKQKRTVTLTYENLLAICSKGQRRFHKLNEWSGVDNSELVNFIAWARTLPYAQEFIFIDELRSHVNEQWEKAG